ncbi:anaphase-promoting complex subunit 4-like isoform X2 [Halichondria panicea]|uniref:anaphase-promoting complex subunit 4-like isoform X2 n=1 Tax=Halichondria panicea TaxID=6063 RepID=UPI00312B5523
MVECLQWAVVMAQCVCIYSVETILAALVYGISIAPCSVLAVGGSDGSVCVYSVEDGNALHRFSAGAPVTHLSWRQLDDIDCGDTKYEQNWTKIIPPLPALDASSGSFESSLKEERDKHPSDPKQLKTRSNKLNLLLIGDEAGRVTLSVSGIFLSACIELGNTSKSLSHVMSTWLSQDFKDLCCTALCSLPPNRTELDLCVQMTSTPLFSTNQCELRHTALMFGQITALLDYINSALKSMYEAWEDLLITMDTKLAAYATTLPEGQTVGDELLVLLACGRARNELQTFLIDELSAVGVKKLGLSLELSYTNIRKYLLCYLNCSIQSLLLHLTDVLGMSRWTDKFGALGLSEDAVQKCINHLGTFALKAQEFLFAIDRSLQSTKTFFVWLYTTILKLSCEPLPKDCNESLTPDELKLMIDFLGKRLRRSASGEGDSRTFNLEVVGQYLVDEDLVYVEESPPTRWDKLVEAADLASEPWIFKPNPKKSLVQLFHTLHKNIDETFAQPMAHMEQSFTSKPTVNLNHYQLQKDVGSSSLIPHQLLANFVYEDSVFVFYPSQLSESSCGQGTCDLTLQSCDGSRKGWFHISEVPALSKDQDTKQKCCIMSLLPYNEDTLSVLFCYLPWEQPQTTPSPESSPVPEGSDIIYHHAVGQLALEALVSCVLCEGVESMDVGAVLTQVCALGPFKAGSMAVSGARKVAAVLTANGRKIRLFDVDAEEDDDD